MNNYACVTCVGGIALKFLKLTLENNKQYFDQYFVITTPEDKDVINFCKDKCNIIVTNLFNKRGAKFNRGAVYNAFFDLIKSNSPDWLILMDCDCFIPSDLGEFIKLAPKENHIFYGCRRKIVPTLSDFNEFNKEFYSPYGFGYGYFQMFNFNDALIKNRLNYPESYDSSNSDWQFRNTWGITINNDIDSINDLKEIKEFILHLGQPNIDGGKVFFQ